MADTNSLVEKPDLSQFNEENPSPIDHDRLHRVITDWREQVLEQVAGQPYDVIGVSSTFEQTNASLILLRACREAHPS